MKKCPYCKIEVGGDLVKCPICQSKLMGEAEEPYFPKQTEQQRRSLYYKVQLFVVWVLVIAGLSIDFLFHIMIPAYPDLHWSLLLTMWLVAFEFLIMRQFKPGTGSARKVTWMVFITLIMLVITSYFLGFLQFTVYWIVPIVLIGNIITNFVFAMIDKKGNTMSYLLTNLFVGVIPYIFLYFFGKGMKLAWIICMILSVILFIGAVIFKGRMVLNEIQRRFNV